MPDTITMSWPAHLSESDGRSPTCWMQIARTGAFVSNRYGKFAITPADLAEMLKNFREVTPVPPTRLPIDYDHLSMDPKKPGDGIAAGWILDLELRGDGHELWAKVEWTAEGARKVKAREYQYVSPSFIRDYIYKTGKKIGTTLVAAAVTNHPFLEGMAAIALSRTVTDIARPETVTVPATPPDKAFIDLVEHTVSEQQVDYRRAIQIASAEQPHWADIYSRGAAESE